MKHDLAKLWAKKEYDVLIMPVAPMPATIQGKTSELITLFSVTFFANFYDMPAGVVPIRLVKEDE